MPQPSRWVQRLKASKSSTRSPSRLQSPASASSVTSPVAEKAVGMPPKGKKAAAAAAPKKKNTRAAAGKKKGKAVAAVTDETVQQSDEESSTEEQQTPPRGKEKQQQQTLREKEEEEEEKAEECARIEAQASRDQEIFERMWSREYRWSRGEGEKDMPADKTASELKAMEHKTWNNQQSRYYRNRAKSKLEKQQISSLAVRSASLSPAVPFSASALKPVDGEPTSNTCALMIRKRGGSSSS